MQILFNNKNVLISGASGHLGNILAYSYGMSGADMLLLLDQESRRDKLESQAEKLREYNIGVKTYYADSTVTADIKKVSQQLKEKNIQVDILINNAGVNVLQKALEITEDMWDYIFDLNVKGSFFLTQEIAKNSLIGRKGNIVFIASQHSVVGNVMRAHYCSSKSGLLGMVRALTAEWSPFGIRVNAVSPTYIMNKGNEEFFMSSEYKRQYLNKIPLKKYASCEDIANAVMFLSSDKAGMITGQNLIIDGGYTSV